MRATSLVVLVVSFLAVLLSSKVSQSEAISSLPVKMYTSSVIPRVVHVKGDSTGLSTTGNNDGLRRTTHLRSAILPLPNNNKEHNEELKMTADEKKSTSPFRRKPLKSPRKSPNTLTLPNIILERVAMRLVEQEDLEALVEAEWQSFIREQQQGRGLDSGEMLAINGWNGGSRHQKITKMLKGFSGTTPESLDLRELSLPIVFGGGDPKLEEEEGRRLWSKMNIDTNYAQPPQNDVKTLGFYKFVHHNQPSHLETGGVTVAQGVKFLAGMDMSLMVPSQHLTLPSQDPKDDLGNWGDRTSVDTGLKEVRDRGKYPPFEVQLGFSVPVNHTTSLRLLNILQFNASKALLLNPLKPTVEVDLETGFGPASSNSQVKHFTVNSQQGIMGHPALNANKKSMSVNLTLHNKKVNPTSCASVINGSMGQLHPTFRIQTDKTFSTDASLDVPSKSNKNFIGLSQIRDDGAKTEHGIFPDLFSLVNIGSELNEASDVSTENTTPKFKLQRPPLPSTTLTVPPREERTQFITSRHNIRPSPSHSGRSESRGTPGDVPGGTHTNNPPASTTISDFLISNTNDPNIHFNSRLEMNNSMKRDMETFRFLNLENTVKIERNNDAYRLDRKNKSHKFHEEKTTEQGTVAFLLRDGEEQTRDIQIKEIKKFIREKGLTIKRNEGAGGGTYTSRLKNIYSEGIPGDFRYDISNNKKATEDHENVRAWKGTLWRIDMDAHRKDNTVGYRMGGFHQRRGQSSAAKINQRQPGENDAETMKDFRPNPQVFGGDPSAAIPVVMAPRLQE